MARGFLNIAGGLLAGVGQGLVKQDEQAQKRGQEERAARLRELERRQDQQFATTERIAGQDFTTARDKATQGAQAERDVANQLHAEKLQNDRLAAEGGMKREEWGAQAKDPLRQAQAEYYRGGGSAGQKMVSVQVDDPDNPGQKKTVYMPVADAAGGEVGGRPGAGKAPPSDYELYRDALKDIRDSAKGARLDAEQLHQEAMKSVRMRKDAFFGQGNGNGGAATPSPAPAAQGEGGNEPEAPRDPSLRVVGTVYRSPTGGRARWTGNGWERM